VGRLREVPGFFSQGETLAELEENIRDAYPMVMTIDLPDSYPGAASKEISVETV
jgi:predicted RNase H-like HicB family nuclease